MNFMTVSRPNPCATPPRRLRLAHCTLLSPNVHTTRSPVSGLDLACAYLARLLITDTAIITLAVEITLFARFGLADPVLLSSLSGERYADMLLLVILSWLTSLVGLRTHDLHVVSVGASEYKQVVNAITAVFGLVAIFFLVAQFDPARWFFIVATPLGMVNLLASRWTWRKWLIAQRKFGHYLSRVIVVASQPEHESDFLRDLAWKLEGKPIELIRAINLADVAGPQFHFRPVDGLPLLHIEIPQFIGGKHLLKRGSDVALSGVALTLLSPLFLIIASLIRANSEGNTFSTQEWVGRNGEWFQIRNFRSVVMNAPELPARHSQLWNVFVGDISPVGPFRRNLRRWSTSKTTSTAVSPSSLARRLVCGSSTAARRSVGRIVLGATPPREELVRHRRSGNPWANCSRRHPSRQCVLMSGNWSRKARRP